MLIYQIYATTYTRNTPRGRKITLHMKYELNMKTYEILIRQSYRAVVWKRLRWGAKEITSWWFVRPPLPAITAKVRLGSTRQVESGDDTIGGGGDIPGNGKTRRSRGRRGAGRKRERRRSRPPAAPLRPISPEAPSIPPRSRAARRRLRVLSWAERRLHRVRGAFSAASLKRENLLARLRENRKPIRPMGKVMGSVAKEIQRKLATVKIRFASKLLGEWMRVIKGRPWSHTDGSSPSGWSQILYLLDGEDEGWVRAAVYSRKRVAELML